MIFQGHSMNFLKNKQMIMDRISQVKAFLRILMMKWKVLIKNKRKINCNKVKASNKTQKIETNLLIIQKKV